MRQLVLAVAALALTVSAASAQQEKNLPNKLMVIEAGDVKVRYLNFVWDGPVFDAMEKGGEAYAATRSWALARILTPNRIMVDGKEVTGGALLILNPASGSEPMTLEIRMVDMRDVIAEGNVIATPPEGTTIHKEPANFEKVDLVLDRLTMKLEETGGTLKLSIHYGNRLRILEAKR